MEQIFEEQNFSEDKLHEECGVFGIFSHNEDVALNTYWGLYALQHRGQESTGIVVTDGERMKIKKGMVWLPMFSRTALLICRVMRPSATYVIPPPVPACRITFSR